MPSAQASPGPEAGGVGSTEPSRRASGHSEDGPPSHPAAVEDGPAPGALGAGRAEPQPSRRWPPTPWHRRPSEAGRGSSEEAAGCLGSSAAVTVGGVPGGPGGVTDRGRPCPHPQGTRWPTAWPAAAPTRSPRWRSAPPSGSSRPPSWPQSPRTSSGCPPRPGRAGASRWRPPSSPPRGEVRPRGHGPGTAGGQGRWRGREPRTWRQEAWARPTRPAQRGPRPRASTTLPSCPGAGASRARPRPPRCRSRPPRPPRPTCQAPGPVLWLRGSAPGSPSRCRHVPDGGLRGARGRGGGGRHWAAVCGHGRGHGLG